MSRRNRRPPPVDTRVVQGPLSGQPCVQLKFVDAGELYLTWRWEHAPEQPRACMIPRDQVQPALDELELAVPSPWPGENVRAALERAFTGPFGNPDREAELTARLAGPLIPFPLAAELNELLGRGIRPHMRIQPSASLGRVPWEALFVDEGRRMVHEAEVSVLQPAGVRNSPGRIVSPYDPAGAVVTVIDPPVPGRVLAPVLRPEWADTPVSEVLSRLGDRRLGAEPAVGGTIDRTALRTVLTGASRLLYVGHVSSAQYGLDVRMHLSDTADTPGRADPIGRHRPLTAADIAFGHADEGPWRIPARVAMIACDSGGDMRFAEPTALVSVMVRGGAEYVTAARWTLPTDTGFALVAGTGVPAFSSAVNAVDAGHEAADPVAALGAWQRAQAECWAHSGSLEYSPLVWGAFSTTWAPPRIMAT
ncbi:CHAT domain-containing protein [Nocardia carnea]|uniref:CHAT domain-containing protein n=1 Tax=Nocardia carnea TaxID=37328 RepID=A0ABW7TWA0_9NOCA|nr:CHAT domain-containing protein [Nocardia carnea]